MQAELRSTRNAQLVAWTVAGLFLIGLFFSPVGAWTGPILGTWFVCTQRPLRGFTWMLAVSFLFSLPATGRIFSQTVLAHGPAQTLDFLSTVFVSLVLPILPFTFHRLVSSRLPGFFSTLPLPLAAMAFPAMILWLHLGAVSQNSLHAFLIFWLAAIIVWLWRQRPLPLRRSAAQPLGSLQFHSQKELGRSATDRRTPAKPLYRPGLEAG